MEGVERFDSEAFGLIQAEAVATDPQQRILLQSTWDALASGSTPRKLSSLVGHNIGAFVGISTGDYSSVTVKAGFRIGPFSFSAASSSQASGRIAFTFGLRGPTASIDTACSSSLVAAHMAVTSFRETSMEGAVVSGVLLCLVPETFIMLAKANLLSEEGRCKTFDAGADGYVRGESCRTLFLTALREEGNERGEVRSEQQMIGLLLGSGVNSNGRALSLTAPNGPAQQALLRDALDASALVPGDVDALHTHSNGTSLGDPIEVGAATAILCQGVSRKAPLLLSTVKGYTGHQEAGAGTVGLLEGLLLAAHEAVAPALHLRMLNPYVASALAVHAASLARGGPYGVPVAQSSAGGSAADRKLFVGVSSFGANGTNAHALVTAPSNLDPMGPVSVGTLSSRLPWHKRRFWALPGYQVSKPLIDLIFAFLYMHYDGQPKETNNVSAEYVENSLLTCIENPFFFFLQALVLSAAVRPHRQTRVPVALFESSLATQRAGFLWDYTIQGTPHIPTSALVSMAASCLPLMAGSEDMCAALAAQTTLATVGKAVLLAPLPLESRRKLLGNPSLGTIMLGLEVSRGYLEAQHAGVTLISCSLRLTKRMSQDGYDAVRTQIPEGAFSLFRPTAAASIRALHGDLFTPEKLGRFGVFSNTAPLVGDGSQGFVVHPAVMECCLSQQSWHAMVRKCASSWVRTLRRLVLTNWQQAPTGSGVVSCGFYPYKLTSYGDSSFSEMGSAGPVFYVGGVEIREHNLPTRKSKQSWFALGPFRASVFGFEATEKSKAERGGGAAEAITMADVLAQLRPDEALRRLQEIVTTEVKALLGVAVHPDDPLMTSGLDSRGGMELRQVLTNATALPVPVNLLYDYQTINDIANYLATLVATHREHKAKAAAVSARADEMASPSKHPAAVEDNITTAAAAAAVAPASDSLGVTNEPEKEIEEIEEVVDDPELREVRALGRAPDLEARVWGVGDPPNPHEVRDRPSELLKVVRPAAIQRPFFLTAPAVASAQAAYFTFVNKYLAVRKKNLLHISFTTKENVDLIIFPPFKPIILQWSDQPVYTLEKHHLSISELAEINARDMLLVQPQGPYLLGGHSYGGTLAIEIAMTLEAWGHEVECIVVMDTPTKEQSTRVPDPGLKRASAADMNEVMEMLLGALGPEIVGIGRGRQHPRDSPEWKAMTVRII